MVYSGKEDVCDEHENREEILWQQQMLAISEFHEGGSSPSQEPDKSRDINPLDCASQSQAAAQTTLFTLGKILMLILKHKNSVWVIDETGDVPF